MNTSPGDATRPFGSEPQVVEQLGEQLRTGARAPTPSAEHIRMRLGLAPAALMRALLDLRATVEDFTPTFGYPCTTSTFASAH